MRFPPLLWIIVHPSSTDCNRAILKVRKNVQHIFFTKSTREKLAVLLKLLSEIH